MQQHALEARQMELQTQDLRRTRTGRSVAAPVVVVDEQAEFERLRREEMQRLDDRIKENTATVRSLLAFGCDQSYFSTPPLTVASLGLWTAFWLTCSALLGPA